MGEAHEAIVTHEATAKCGDRWGGRTLDAVNEGQGTGQDSSRKQPSMPRGRASIRAGMSKGEEHSRGDDSVVDKAGGESW